MIHKAGGPNRSPLRPQDPQPNEQPPVRGRPEESDRIQEMRARFLPLPRKNRDHFPDIHSQWIELQLTSTLAKMGLDEKSPVPLPVSPLSSTYPIVHIRQEQFIPLTSGYLLPLHFHQFPLKTPADVKGALLKIVERVHLEVVKGKRRELRLDQGRFLFLKIGDYLSIPRPLSGQEYYNHVITQIREDALNGPRTKAESEALNHLLEAFYEEIGKSSIEQLPRLYSREEIASNLRIHLTSDNLVLLDAIEKSGQRFIPMEGIPPEWRSYSLQNCSPFLSTKDYLSVAGPQTRVEEDLEAVPMDIADNERTPFTGRVGLSFKMGRGNIREQLANRLRRMIGLEGPLVKKIPYHLRGGAVEGIKNPRGLVSAWVDRGQKINTKLIGDYLDLRRKLDLHAPSERDLDRLAFLERELLSGARNDVPQIPDVQFHALMDLIFYSVDSHSGQYLVDRGQAVCVDFGEFLPPALASRRGSGDLFLLFRSYFIDHPACELPISSELAHLFRTLDLLHLRNRMREEGLIGNWETYRQYEARIPVLYQQLQLLRKGTFSDGNVRNLLTDLGIEDLSLLHEERRKELMQVLEDRYDSLRKASLSQIHPEACEGLLERLARIQELVLHSPHPPTVMEIFASALPEVATFYSLFWTYEDSDPGEGLSKIFSQEVENRALNQWFTSIAPGITDPEEERAALAALYSLQLEACDPSAVCLAIDESPRPPPIPRLRRT